MPNVSGDNSAFVIAVSCSTPNAMTPSAAASTSATNVWNSVSSISVTVGASGAVAGTDYRLCVRWSAVSPYFDAGSFDLLSVTSVVPSVIPASAVTQTLTVSGAGLVNVAADAGGFVISGNCNGTPTSAVTSVVSSFTSSTSVSLTVNANGATAGVYLLCMRDSTTSVYFSSGATVTIGEI